MTGHTVGVVKNHLGFGVSSSRAFHCQKLEVQGLHIAIFTRFGKMTLYPLKRLISCGSPIELSAHHVLGAAECSRGVLWWLAVAADGKHESALGKGFPDPCRGRSLGRPAPFEPMKLPSEACILRQSARQLSAASGGPPSHPIKSSFAGIGPTASQGLR